MDRQERGCRLVAIDLEESGGGQARGFINAERLAAVRDLIAENTFKPAGCTGRELRLKLAIRDNRLIFDTAEAEAAPLVRHILSLTPLNRVLKDYLQICESYNVAAGTLSPRQLEAIDMGRRGLHNEGAETLQERLK